MTQLLGTISSLNASLTVAVFDARSADAWIPTKAAANKAQFTGHPAEILRGLGKGEELTQIDVGSSTGVAFELEGTSGKLDVHCVADGIAFAAPGTAVEELVEDQATELGEIEIASGRLAAVYIWLPGVNEARDLAVASGAAASFGEGGGVVIDLAPGRYRVLHNDSVMFFVRG